jgi:hypothetical protein
MKTKMNFLTLMMLSIFLVSTLNSFAQQKSSIAVVSIDTKGMASDNIGFANLVRLELEKLNYFEVLDIYEINAVLSQNKVDKSTIFAKSDLVRVGKMLSAQRMLSGSAEKFGNKIALSFRMINVSDEKIESTVVLEFIDMESQINTMVKLALNTLLGLPVDQTLMDMLSYFDTPIINEKTMLKLNGPRMGAAYTFGRSGERLMDAKSNGGYEMFPVTTVFGYQHEAQYLSSGDFSALVEFIGTVSGLESGYLMPSLTFMNGFRFNKSGLEFGLGPVVRVVKTAKGYYDGEGDWNLANTPTGGYDLVSAIDNRGTFGLSAGLIIALGKTFRSGYLNIPVNVYISPRKEGTVVGMTFGFNIAKR